MPVETNVRPTKPGGYVLQEYREISLKELFTCILEKISVIILTTIIFGVAAFSITKYAITPKYDATIRLYVNNRTEATNTLTTSDVAAAKSLVNTYITIIESNSVLDDISKRLDSEYTPNQIKKMMSAKAINGTEVFEVTITDPSPENSADIANLIADIAPDKISEIVNGSSVKIIDRAKVPTEPVSPIMSKNIAISCLLGLLISSFIIVLLNMFDTTIYSEDDIKDFCTLPILGIFSDFNQVSQNKYGYSYGGRSKKSE